MAVGAILPVGFYEDDAVVVARRLLGMRLVRWLDGQRLSGIIIETEAYRGETDLACHARAGRTPRTAVMYGPPGRAYVYFTYGMHWCFNAVTGSEGFAAAVLVRSLRPEEGLETMARLRAGRKQSEWCSGPARLTRALAVDGSLNGIDLCDSRNALGIEYACPPPDEQIAAGPRVGIERVPEPWKSMPWRFRWVDQP